MGLTPPDDQGRTILERLLSYTRTGEPPPMVDLDPQAWMQWAGGVYATAVNMHREPPPGEARCWTGRKPPERNPALANYWRRMTGFQRKCTAYALFALAHERVEAGDERFRPLAQRFADRYFDQPGGDVPDAPALAAIERCRSLERCRRIELHPDRIASREAWKRRQLADRERNWKRHEARVQEILDLEPWRASLR
jgi:hypothetical protein